MNPLPAMPFRPDSPAVPLATANDMRERIRRKSYLKGRQPELEAMAEVAALLDERPAEGFRRDLLIEYLHRLNDHFGVLHDRHLVALARQMNVPMAEVYEVASFYHHFEIVRGADVQAPRLVLRVCDSLGCSLAGARDLLAATAGAPARRRAVATCRCRPCLAWGAASRRRWRCCTSARCRRPRWSRCWPASIPCQIGLWR